MTRKFYRQVFTVEVLSEDEPLRSDNLSEIDYAITFGDCSGMINETVQEEVTAKEMAQLLMNQGSDPGFFRIDEDGNDLEGDGDIDAPPSPTSVGRGRIEGLVVDLPPIIGPEDS